MVCERTIIGVEATCFGREMRGRISITPTEDTHMDKKTMHLSAIAFMFAALSVLPARAGNGQPDPEVIIEWNQLLQQNLTGPPFVQVRAYAMLHIAMADAVVAIEGRYEPYHAEVHAPRGASAEIAAAQAGRDILAALIPANVSVFNSALASRIATVPPGQAARGSQVGKKVAAAIIAWRQNDGSAVANPQPPAFLPSTLPGIWRQTATGPAQFSEFGAAVPFGLLTSTQYLPAPFPQLESPEYAQDFNEVKSVGRATSTTRTPEQTRFAQLFAGVGTFANVTNPFRLWSNVARDVAEDKSLSLVATARLFALMAASIHDSVQTSQGSKFVYRLWRPETAIDQAGVDNNPATDPEALWPPLLATPPYPSHSSNMTCIGTAAARMLGNVFGDAQPFTATWYSSASPPTVVHAQPYNSFSALAQDEADSRVWGGIHFRFELETSQVSCAQVADYIFDNYMVRTRHKN
jgi:hypothetical protein